jgi:hypothetical protein
MRPVGAQVLNQHRPESMFADRTKQYRPVDNLKSSQSHSSLQAYICHIVE